MSVSCLHEKLISHELKTVCTCLLYWSAANYNTDMQWDADAEHSIIQIMATDTDSGVEGTISYSIVEGNSRVSLT